MRAAALADEPGAVHPVVLPPRAMPSVVLEQGGMAGCEGEACCIIISKIANVLLKTKCILEHPINVAKPLKVSQTND